MCNPHLATLHRDNHFGMFITFERQIHIILENITWSYREVFIVVRVTYNVVTLIAVEIIFRPCISEEFCTPENNNCIFSTNGVDVSDHFECEVGRV